MSEYRKRLSEHQRHKRLGCFIRISAVAAAIIITGVSLSAFPRIPVIGSLAFYALAALLFGAVERALRLMLGYQREKASVLYLRSDAPDSSSPMNFDSLTDGSKESGD